MSDKTREIFYSLMERGAKVFWEKLTHCVLSHGQALEQGYELDISHAKFLNKHNS